MEDVLLKDNIGEDDLQISCPECSDSLRKWFHSFYEPAQGDHEFSLSWNNGINLFNLFQKAYPKSYEVPEKNDLDIEKSTCQEIWKVNCDILSNFSSFKNNQLLRQQIMISIEEEHEKKQFCLLAKILELTICSVVECENKEFFIHKILELDQVQQAQIMKIIQKNMEARNKDFASKDYENHHENNNHSNNMNKHEIQESLNELNDDTLYQNTETQKKKLVREIEVLKDENFHMQDELKSVTNKYNKLFKAYEELQIQIDNFQKNEVTLSIEKQDTLKEKYDTKLFQKQKEIEEIQIELDKLQKNNGLISELRDEIDLLRPAAEKVKKLEALIEKYRDRLENSSIMKEQGKRLEETNQELIQKNLLLEAEIKKIPNLLQKLDKYKTNCTNSSVHITELEEKLEKIQHENMNLKNEMKSNQEALVEQNSKIEELQMTIRDLQENGGHASLKYAPSLGGGVSELNPELTEKVARLEYENSTLKAQLSGETTEIIDSLREKIDETERLSKSFEKKFFDKRDEYNQCFQELEDEKDQHSKLKTCYNELMEKLNEITDELSREITTKQQLQKDIIHVEDQLSVSERNCKLADEKITELESSITRNEIQHLNIIKEMNQSQNILMDNHKNEIDNIKLSMESMINDFESQKDMWKKEEEAMIVSFQNDKVKTTLLCEEEIENLRKTNEKEVKKFEEEFSLLKSVHTKEISSLQSTIEEKCNELELLEGKLATFKSNHSISNEKHNEELAKMMDNEQNLKKEYNDSVDLYKKKISEYELKMESLNEKTSSLENQLRKQCSQLAEKIRYNEGLEIKVDQLESKLRLLGKERMHLSSEAMKTRENSSAAQSLTHQTETQLETVRDELEKLQDEYKVLLEKQKNCACGRKRNCDKNDLNSYVDSVRQLEAAKHQEDEKRRELVLVNSKLIQEQRQVHAKVKQLMNEKQQLQDRLNSALLREERRKKAGQLDNKENNSNANSVVENEVPSVDVHDQSHAEENEETTMNKSPSEEKSVAAKKRRIAIVKENKLNKMTKLQMTKLQIQNAQSENPEECKQQ